MALFTQKADGRTRSGTASMQLVGSRVLIKHAAVAHTICSLTSPELRSLSLRVFSQLTAPPRSPAYLAVHFGMRDLRVF